LVKAHFWRRGIVLPHPYVRRCVVQAAASGNLAVHWPDGLLMGGMVAWGVGQKLSYPSEKVKNKKEAICPRNTAKYTKS